MRFSLRRRATADDLGASTNGGNANASRGEAAASVPSAVAVATPPAPVRRDWESLPAMQLTVADARPAPNGFAEGLASKRDIALTHQSSPRWEVDAPAGFVEARVAPTEPRIVWRPNGDDQGSPLPVIEQRRARPSTEVSAPRADVLPVAVAPTIAAPPVAEVGLPSLGLDTMIDAAIRASGGDPWGRPKALPPIDPPAPRVVGPRHTLADSRRMGLGPAYHGSLPEAMHDERTRTEPVPEGVREVIQQTLGVDIGDRVVHRGPTVSAEASAIGAQAFTRDRQVYVADDVGSLDSAQARATVAHEMTHVAQQIRSTIVPDERSPEGILHEYEAQSVEQFVRGDAHATRPEMIHVTHPVDDLSGDADDPGAAATATMRDLVARGVARWDGTGGIELIPPAERGVGSGGTQRATATAPPAAPPAAPAARSTPAGGAAAGAATPQAGYTTNYGVGGFFHDLGNEIADEAMGTMGSVFGFSDSFMDEQRREMAHEDRDWLSTNYRETRLEHRQQGRLTELNNERAVHHEEPLAALSDDDLQEITEQVNEDVGTRMALLQEEERKANEKLNEHRQANQPEQHVERDKLERAYHTVFDDPDKDDLPTAAQIATLLGNAATATATAAATGAAAAARSTAGSTAGGPAASTTPTSPATPTTTTPTTTPADATSAATTPAGTTPTDTTSTGTTPTGTTPTGTTPTGTTPTGTTPTGTTPTRTAPGTTPTSTTPTGTTPTGTTPGATTPAAGATTEPTDWAGQNRADAQRATDEQQQWSDPNLTMGQRFSTLGSAIGFDLMGGMVDTEMSMFGFSDSFSREVHAGMEHDRHQTMEGIRHPGDAATAGAAAGATAGTAAATTPAAAAGAHDPAHDTHAGNVSNHDTHAAAAGAAAGHAATQGHADAEHHQPRTSPTGEPMVEVSRLDMEQLAERLYPNIRSRLRQELLIDRERAGMLTDFR